MILFTGVTALDLISDFDEWIESGFFTEEIVARLKGLSYYTSILLDRKSVV